MESLTQKTGILKTIVRRPRSDDRSIFAGLGGRRLKPEEAFSHVLRSLRKEKGLSQDELAHQSNLDRTYISLLERGLRQPSLSSILQLSKPLGVSSSEILAQVEARISEDTPD